VHDVAGAVDHVAARRVDRAIDIERDVVGARRLTEALRLRERTGELARRQQHGAQVRAPRAHLGVVAQRK
jgi:hypothetical protein